MRQPPIIQEPDPEEERERERELEREHEKERERERERHGRSSRGHRGCRLEPDRDRGEARLRPGHQEAMVAEQGREEEEYGNDGEKAKPRLKPTMRPITAAVAVVPLASSASANVSPNTPGDESPCGIIIPHENSPPDALPQDDNRPRIGLSLKLGESLSRTK